MKTNNIIEITNLSFGYRNQQILKEVSVAFPANEFSVILGRNGSGKSTLLRLIAGLLPHCKGAIRINGIELNNLSSAHRAYLVGFLQQSHKPVFPFTVKDVVLTGRAAFIGYLPTKEDHIAVDDAMERTAITHLQSRLYTELSGGEQQLVMLTRLIAQQPDILLLDEPISHLDYNNQIHIIKLIKQLVNDGFTIISVLHDPNMAFLFGDRFFFVDDQKVYADNSSEPWKSPLIHKVFHNSIVPVPHAGKMLFIPSLQ
ncbi:ABC transporter ATP-binding protein [Alkaliflexus imshenetskii]|uniref:ABC transporter ATP-binding protein n=1 Tax=Alkaliflexus imshenetskii TaxID=286730 RepID=UPI0004B01BAA|nr:ABC transporter ATP-binding protein [Alkaliflexus imshenetskii]